MNVWAQCHVLSCLHTHIHIHSLSLSLAHVQVWDAATGRLKKDLQYQAEEMFMMHDEAVLSLGFSRDSELLVSGVCACAHSLSLVRAPRARVCAFVCCHWGREGAGIR